MEEPGLTFRQRLILVVVGAATAGFFGVLAAMTGSSGSGVVMQGMTINPGSAYAISNGGSATSNVNTSVQDNRSYSNNGSSVNFSNNSSVVQSSNASSVGQ